MNGCRRSFPLAWAIAVGGCYSAAMPIAQDDGGSRDAGGGRGVLVTYELGLGLVDWPDHQERSVLIDDILATRAIGDPERHSQQVQMPISPDNAYPSVPLAVRITDSRSGDVLFESEIGAVRSCPIFEAGQRVTEFGFSQILRYPVDDHGARIPEALPELVTGCGFCQYADPAQRSGWCF